MAVIEYLYTGSLSIDVSTAAEVISLANLWQLPGLDLESSAPLHCDILSFPLCTHVTPHVSLSAGSLHMLHIACMRTSLPACRLAAVAQNVS